MLEVLECLDRALVFCVSWHGKSYDVVSDFRFCRLLPLGIKFQRRWHSCDMGFTWNAPQSNAYLIGFPHPPPLRLNIDKCTTDYDLFKLLNYSLKVDYLDGLDRIRLQFNHRP